jgi:hypothetical protein
MMVGAQALPVAQGTLPFVPLRVRMGEVDRVQVTRSGDDHT